jgi:membrane-bound lytic murein transglycosylase D
MKFPRRLYSASVHLAAVFLLLSTGLASAKVLQSGGDGGLIFQSPPGLKENVNFWRDVFSRYKISEVVFHDENNLRLRYDIIRLEQDWRADQKQKNRLRKHKKVIKDILLTLSEGRWPSSGHDSLATRISRMFTGRPRSEMRQAAFNVRAQPGLKERFLEGYIRSGRYLSRFLLIFRKYGLPEELTLLPHVESGFRANISSHAGALGLWQFTRSTGRLFMRVDGTVDGRRDPFLAAEAAAKLLKQNYNNLQSWPLAITAYNHGAQGMRRAVKQVGSRRIDIISKNYKSRTFGFASRNFYAEFLAALHVHENVEKYFGKVRSDSQKHFDEFNLPGYARIGELARRIGVKAKVLKKLNPALSTAVIRGRRNVPRGYPLRLPAGDLARVRLAYYQNTQDAPPAPKDDGSKWVLVRPGDTLGAIARRNRVRLKELMNENGLKKSLIVVGVRLRLPDKASSKNQQTASLKRVSPKPDSTSQVKRKKKNKQAASVKPTVKKTIQAAKKQAAKRKTVSLAKKTIPKAASLYETLTSVPRRGSEYREGALRQAVAVSASDKKNNGWVRIQENETISHLSRWLKVSQVQIRRMNGIRSNSQVRMGKRIQVSFQQVPKNDFLERRVTYHKNIEKTFFDKFTISEVKRHKLMPGENVWTLIMRTYKVPFWLMRQYNTDKNLRRLKPGVELAIPVVERRTF